MFVSDLWSQTITRLSSLQSLSDRIGFTTCRSSPGHGPVEPPDALHTPLAVRPAVHSVQLRSALAFVAAMRVMSIAIAAKR
jgi:hypothetical protein